MKQMLKDYFSFTNSQRNGILVLVILLALAIFSFQLYSYCNRSKPVDLSGFSNQVDQFLAKQEAAEKVSQKKLFGNRDKNKDSEEIEYFDFDPNSTSIENWKRLGMRDWQINGILKYVKRGGRFNVKSDFAKLHVVKQADFEALHPYIQILPDSSNVFDERKKPESKTVDINSADVETLKQLKGIGPVFSARIVKYRNKLGGFISKDQLLEVYGMDSLTVFEISDNILITDSLRVKININDCALSILGNHPYVPWNVARSIVNYREQHGPYSNVSEIRNTDLVNDDLYRKIAPYFSVQ
jgi:competence ComEA-like helix-hairpin-helix protein